MKTKVILIFIGFIILVLALDYSSILWEGFIGPKRQDVRRKIFKETRSYNEAKLQELLKYRKEYLMSKDEVEKSVLASTIRHAFAEYDESKLPYDLKQFLKEIKY
jgi:hypothetical protein